MEYAKQLDEILEANNRLCRGGSIGTSKYRIKLKDLAYDEYSKSKYIGCIVEREFVSNGEDWIEYSFVYKGVKFFCEKFVRRHTEGYEEKNLLKTRAFDYQYLQLGIFYLPDIMFAKVMEQTHREKKFGDNGVFKASNGKKLRSHSNTLNNLNIGIGDEFFVRGSNGVRDDIYVAVSNNDIADLRLMVKEYNYKYSDPKKIFCYHNNKYTYTINGELYKGTYEVIY